MTETLKIGKYEIKKIWLYVLFIILSAVQLGMLIYTFATKKEGYHSDELWSYGYANSYYSPHIYQNQQGESINQYEWTDGSVLNDYLVVNEGEEFSYGSVIYNHTYDLSPPLHSLVLHTICSFFPEKFSPWYSFSINIVSFVITIVFLFLCVRLLKDELIALLACAWYGFASVTIDNFIYLRPYAMATALFTVLLYLNLLMLDKVKKKEKLSPVLFVVMGAVAYLGFMTHYYFILATGIMTALICIYLMFKKRFKVMFAYGGSMLAALALTTLCCSNMFDIIGAQKDSLDKKTDDGLEYSFIEIFRMLINAMTNRLMYFSFSIYGSALPKIILACIIFAIIISLSLLYLLRNTKPVINMRKKLGRFAGKPLLYVRHFCRHVNWVYMILLITMAIYLIIVANTANVSAMGTFSSRYIFMFVPAFVIMIIGFIHGLLKLFFRRKSIVSDVIIYIFILAYVIADICLYGSYKSYFFRKKTVGRDISEVVTGANCIYVDRNDWLIQAFSERLRNVNSYFKVSDMDYMFYSDEYNKAFEQDEALYVIIDDIYSSSAEYLSSFAAEEDRQDVYDYYMRDYYAIINYFSDLYPDYTIEKVSEEIVYSYKMDVYLLKPAN